MDIVVLNGMLQDVCVCVCVCGWEGGRQAGSQSVSQ
jgi:hypothetical protein